MQQLTRSQCCSSAQASVFPRWSRPRVDAGTRAYSPDTALLIDAAPSSSRHQAAAASTPPLCGTVRPRVSVRASTLSADAAQEHAPRAALTLVSGLSRDANARFFHHVLSQTAQPHSTICALLEDSWDAVTQRVQSSAGTSAASGLLQLPSGHWLGRADEPEHQSQAQQLLASGKVSQVLIQNQLTGSPLATAASLADLHPELTDCSTVGSLITVLDAQSFVNSALSSTSLEDAGLVTQGADQGSDGSAEDEGELFVDDRTVADVLIDQVEYATTLIAVDIDTLPSQNATTLHCLLTQLNRSAKVASLSSITAATLTQPHTPLDLDTLQEDCPGWAVEIRTWSDTTDTSTSNNTHTTDKAINSTASEPTGTESKTAGARNASGQSPPAAPASADACVARGVRTWRYGAQRPLHPARLLSVALAGTWPGVVRSKGYVWLATRNDSVGLWQSAGGSWQCEPSGVWAASVPPSERPSDLDISTWHPQWGDRCTQLVWTGVNMQESVLRAMLDQCLLTDEEMSAGPDAWAQYEDPLPPWEHESDHDHEDHDHKHNHTHEHTQCCDHEHDHDHAECGGQGHSKHQHSHEGASGGKGASHKQTATAQHAV